MFKLVKKGYNPQNDISYGNMFLIGNGHIGYRGTLEEFDKSKQVGINIIGEYDQFQDKWRESINAPNPFYVKVNNYSLANKKFKNHYQQLDLKNIEFSRCTKFKDLIISSKRIVSQYEQSLLMMEYEIKSLKDQKIIIELGIDYDIWDINGPHLSLIKQTKNNEYLSVLMKSNEGKYLSEIIFVDTKHKCNKTLRIDKKLLNRYIIEAKKDQKINFNVMACIEINKNKNIALKNKKQLKNIVHTGFNYQLKKHQNEAEKMWKISDVKLIGDKKAQFALRYSIYHLLILANKKYVTSIPARGLSGQTYKGAIFWDTEIFMLPFYTLTNPEVAKNLIKYRINTLSGAKNKAESYGYNGAFYAWESQEKGQDACSLYNISDPLTNKPIRTYFADKQIHISGDVALAIINTYEKLNDISILINGGLEVLLEVIKFYMSYSKDIDGKYHLYDVIGPDEYHERVNDNAFTNYLVYKVCEKTLDYLSSIDKRIVNKLLKDVNISIQKISHFKNNLYLYNQNSEGIIEQFSGYFDLNDSSIEEIKSSLSHKNEYWGNKAKFTKIIKQADVVTMLAIFKDDFSESVKMKNYEYYQKVCEHGSSLSSSMHSLLACDLNKANESYEMFLKSALIDLGTEQKMYAGGIYIGGTHPASNGGAYNSVVFGYSGLKYENNKIIFNPKLPNNIKKIEFCYFEYSKIKKVTIKDNVVKISEVKL